MSSCVPVLVFNFVLMFIYFFFFFFSKAAEHVLAGALLVKSGFRLYVACLSREMPLPG